eukprot:jgi/Tetstr1/436492/TSEL_025320.t1
MEQEQEQQQPAQEQEPPPQPTALSDITHVQPDPSAISLDRLLHYLGVCTGATFELIEEMCRPGYTFGTITLLGTDNDVRNASQSELEHIRLSNPNNVTLVATADCLRAFINLVRTLDHQLKALRLDNDTAYRSAAFVSTYHEAINSPNAVERNRDSGATKIHQSEYIHDMLARFDMVNCRITAPGMIPKTPSPTQIQAVTGAWLAPYSTELWLIDPALRKQWADYAASCMRQYTRSWKTPSTAYAT